MKRLLLGIAVTIGLMAQLKAAENDFEGYFTYEMEVMNADELKGEKVNEMTMTFYIKGQQTLIDFKNRETQGMKILINREEEAIYQLMQANNQKMAMKMDLDKLKEMGQEEDMKKGDLKTRKTGKTKSILGYNCNQRSVTSEDVEGHVWVTKEVDINLGKIFEVMNKHPRNKFGKKKVRSAYSYPFKGFVMESVMKDKNEETKIKTRVTELKSKSLGEKRFDISGYRVMNMNGGMHQQNDR